ncbi:GatB/YqeY domain-containing protein [Leptothoe spongobia]|uniref:GatB/YqeY domain-containing protein n=1 Tax=Leptothoe spongobia TAU-MAC 1115 TaxID=1967444 RepID=A0A947GHP8_9CYAN|nr:GatB/YqeY domain-containing protein [Leptothoe spongobia]MBT9315099.1 GatB/YqeY domain-containing protein [Leptothoe spongobia TAU-MAC 1115]
MSLKDRISDEIKAAMKARDKIRLETLRSIKKVIIEKESEVRPHGQDALTPEQEVEIVTQLAKQRKDSIEQYNNAGREDRAEKEAQELAILQEYLPAQMSDDEVEAVIDELIAKTGASGPRDMGKVMGPAMKQMKGKADGAKVQAFVKAKLVGS